MVLITAQCGTSRSPRERNTQEKQGEQSNTKN